jgi:hypothetical protein
MIQSIIVAVTIYCIYKSIKVFINKKDQNQF